MEIQDFKIAISYGIFLIHYFFIKHIYLGLENPKIYYKEFLNFKTF